MFNLNGDALDGMVGEFGEEIPYLIETVGAGQEPEFDEERRLILGLEAQLDDLTYLMSDIRRAGGMCQDFAMEAFRLVPAFESMGGLGYYTKAPSKTRLNVAMEELHKGIWAAIAAAAAVVSFAIYRFIRWLAGGKGDDAKDAKNPPDATKVKDVANEAKKKIAEKHTKADIVADAEEKVADALHTAQNELEGTHPNLVNTAKGTAGVSSAFDLFYHDFVTTTKGNDGARAFMKLANGEYADIIQEGPWSKQIEKLAGIMGAVKTQLINRFKSFEQITEYIDRGDQTEMSKIEQEVKVLLKPISVAGFAGATDLSGVAVHMKELKQAARAKQAPANHRVNLERTLRFLNAKKKSTAFSKLQQLEEHFPEEQVEIAKYQDTIRKVLAGKGSPMVEGHPNGMPLEYSRDVGKVARELQADFLEYLQLCGQIAYYTQSLVDCGSEVMAIVTINYNRMKEFLADQPDIKMPEEMTEAVRYIHQTKKATKPGMNFWGKAKK